MVRILALVEGPTERNFGQKVLATHFGSLNIDFRPRVIGKPGHKGGVGAWERAKKELVGLIRHEPAAVVTTMFDLYGLHSSWPGRAEVIAKGMKNHAAVTFIEREIASAIDRAFQGSHITPRFIPYLSQHEYEALLFSEPATLAGVTGGADHVEKFKAVLAECGGCEEINDHPKTAPSKRIIKIARGYQKTVDGITAAERIGLKTLRAQCPHFAQWMTRLEAFAE